MTINEYVRLAIRRWKDERNMTHKELSERSGIPLGSISCLLSGSYRISLGHLLSLSLALGRQPRDAVPEADLPGSASGGSIERFVLEAYRNLPRRIGYAEVIEVACRSCNVQDVKELLKPSRLRKYSLAKAVIATLAQATPGLKLNGAAKLLGVSPGALTHLLRRMRGDVVKDAQLDEAVLDALRMLKERRAE